MERRAKAKRRRRRQLNERARKRKRDVRRREHERGFPSTATAARNQHTTGTILLTLIAAFSEVSGEAAYEVSMMHLGATGREGISTVLLLHTHTAPYCSVSTIFPHTVML